MAIATAEAAATVKTVTLLEQDPGSSPGFFFAQTYRGYHNLLQNRNKNHPQMIKMLT